MSAKYAQLSLPSHELMCYLLMFSFFLSQKKKKEKKISEDYIFFYLFLS